MLRERHDRDGGGRVFGFVAIGARTRGGLVSPRSSVLARNAKDAREKGDYEANPPSAEEAAEFLSAAERFLAAVETMLSEGS